ncbi:recombinase family protein [Streptomyces ochraceiscleroticus]|uniref:Recombinase family protein n=1 Tax=Streptomyces ochraceiscleroticus TaxID=47761 RepID=A0ABW1MT14_9ACTN|nr:recombinase family protein [Streptomyces ochraceiscleroticus]
MELWVPEVGGPINADSEAHDLVMSVFGGMSKGERNRIKVRVRAAMASQAQIESRFLGERPPYGYRIADADPHPNPAKAADAKRLHRLEPDPATAPIVRRIFAEYLRGRGYYAIAEGLTRDDIPCPSAYDRARNPHRSGTAWAKNAVRAIICNPRYTGHQVWNRQHKQEVLLDVEDVALGYQTRLRWNSQDDWIWSKNLAHPLWSKNLAHPPLIAMEDYLHATEIRASNTRQKGPKERRPKVHTYVLTGLLHCARCQRKNDQPPCPHRALLPLPLCRGIRSRQQNRPRPQHHPA